MHPSVPLVPILPWKASLFSDEPPYLVNQIRDRTRPADRLDETQHHPTLIWKCLKRNGVNVYEYLRRTVGLEDVEDLSEDVLVALTASQLATIRAVS